MLTQNQKESITTFLNENTPTAAAYYVRMASMEQKNRMSPETFTICQNIISEFDNRHIDAEDPTNQRNGNDLKEDRTFKTIIDNATMELIGISQLSKISTVIDYVMKKMFKEKTPNTGHSGIQKQYFNHTGQIFMNHYSKTPNVVEKYTKIAKNDFPGLKNNDIDVVIFGGIRKKGVMGIRFRIPKTDTPPSDYFEWSDPYNLDELI